MPELIEDSFEGEDQDDFEGEPEVTLEPEAAPAPEPEVAPEPEAPVAAGHVAILAALKGESLNDKIIWAEAEIAALEARLVQLKNAHRVAGTMQRAVRKTPKQR
jgi:hypothetical protein